MLFPAAGLFCLLLLFTHPAAAASGCSKGLLLWYSAVLPSLLPFLILSSVLIRTGLFRYLNRLYAPFLCRLFHISEDGCYAVILGFLCGFPMGAKVIADLVRERCISSEEGNYLLGFCNNVSPAFFLNYVCLLQLGYTSVPWSLVCLFYGLALLYGLLSRPFCHFFPNPDTTQKQASLHRLDFPMLDACIMDSFATITRLGGYIMLFTIFIEFLYVFPIPSAIRILISALMEISSGTAALAASPVPEPLRTAFVCSCAAFGGLCICAQTKSVLEGTSLSIVTWLKGRVILALLLPVLLQLLSGEPALHGCW